MSKHLDPVSNLLNIETIQEIDYQDIIYYSAPKQKEKISSLDEVDPKLLETF